MIITTIIVFLIILGLLVFVHELGHFVVARRNGITVHEFGFGLPPRMVGIRHTVIASELSERGNPGIASSSKAPRNDKKKKWEFLWGSKELAEESSLTIYSLNWIPLGGFVKIKGEQGEGKGEPDSFASKKAGPRILVLSSGVLMNIVLAAFLFIVGFSTGLPTALDETIEAQAKNIRNRQIIIASVLPGSPASIADLQTNDVISSLDGNYFTNSGNFISYIEANQEKELVLEVERSGEILSFPLTPAIIDNSPKALIGIEPIDTGEVSFPLGQAIVKGISATFLMVVGIFKIAGVLLASLFGGPAISGQVAGPVGIAVLTGQVVNLGLPYVIQFAAVLSINLAIINILPFPALDGGRILFIIIEKLRGKPVSQKFENVTHSIGFALLILLILLVTYKDIARIFTQN